MWLSLSSSFSVSPHLAFLPPLALPKGCSVNQAKPRGKVRASCGDHQY
jgi:hypothetical protein